MTIAIAGPRPVDLPWTSLRGLRIACYAAGLYAICVVTPTIYTASPAVRAYRHEADVMRNLQIQELTLAQRCNRAVLTEASHIESADARAIFLNDGLERAIVEMEGVEEQVRFEGVQDQEDTFLNRLVGNKVLEWYGLERLHKQSRRALARQNVADLRKALLACRTK